MQFFVIEKQDENHTHKISEMSKITKKNILDNFLISAELPESLAVDGYALHRCPQAKYKHYLPRTKAANQMLTYALNGYLALVTKTDQTKTIYIINVFVDTVSK